MAVADLPIKFCVHLSFLYTYYRPSYSYPLEINPPHLTSTITNLLISNFLRSVPCCFSGINVTAEVPSLTPYNYVCFLARVIKLSIHTNSMKSVIVLFT